MGCLFVYWFTVDRHGLRPRDDKGELVEDTVCLLVHSGSPRAFSPRDDKGGWVCGEKRKGQSLLFTLYPSIFTHFVRRSIRLAPRGFRPAWAKTPLAPLHYWLFWKPTRKPMKG